MQDPKFFAEHNARHFWHPMAHPAEMREHPPIVVASAEGVEITDVNGHTALDAVGGLWNVNLGYSCQPIKDAINEQLATLPYYSTFRGTSNAPAVELSYALTEWFKEDGLVRAFFTSGGSDAVETALRLARQYHRIRGELDRTKFISLLQGYHGTHFGGASVNGSAKFRRNYEPMLPGCFHIPAPWPYRNPFDESDPARLAELCASMLEAEIKFQSPDTVAAFIMEPVLGAGGVIVPHESFMPMVRDICDRHGVLLIADEVITAFGRTGAWTGSRLWGVKPDLACIAKGITNGYFPFGATMISEKIANAFEENRDGFGSIGHGYTYSAHPVGAAAALAALREIDKSDVAGNAALRGDELIAGCRKLQDQHSMIGDVRGKGLMIALELVADRETKKPLGKDKMETVLQTAYKDGVMVR
ncbi:MAG: aminotransferase class III-fold pyridoxal phosphate-dependent enzyme, partial [Gammaproteobacteria bacterium]|nr:aminotransferase class III-fold pyridoxal phosphate-dependent enzyme [Gammaproteobacteria bacterium]